MSPFRETSVTGALDGKELPPSRALIRGSALPHCSRESRPQPINPDGAPMNDDRNQAAAPEQATTDLPLQAQLMGSLALVFILSAVAGLVGYAAFDGTSLEKGVASKSSVYASTLTSQGYNA